MPDKTRHFVLQRLTYLKQYWIMNGSHFILETKVFLSESKDPYLNLSVEKYLTEQVQKGQAYLYLWQNENTVVIGRNQNPYAECDIKKIREDNVNIARRLSGGGAVFHDLGNLNFSFINHESEQQIETNMSVILTALESFGLHAEFMGRNDYRGK